MEELNLDFWRQRGWLIPGNFTLDEDQAYIDYTSQYLFAIPINKSITNKLSYLKNELRPLIIEKLSSELLAEEEGELDCLDHIKFHLGEILDDNFYVNPCEGVAGIVCSSCSQQSPNTFQICWLCGQAFEDKGEIKAYANVFVELTGSVGIDDLIGYQFDEGPSRFKEISWVEVNRQSYVDLCELPQSSFKTKKGQPGDYNFETEEFEVFVRFNPLPVIDSN
jgi:hypothetical protein